jgi:hypothetical protein
MSERIGDCIIGTDGNGTRFPIRPLLVLTGLESQERIRALYEVRTRRMCGEIMPVTVHRDKPDGAK